MSSAASEHVMTPENEFKLFEALIINGGAKSATIGEARLYPRKIIEAGTFKRSSSPGIPLPATAGPAHLRSSTYRRSSIKSVHSDRISIKSTHRAEKEWRARVAGLAGRKSTLSTLPVEIRGPVPPRRTPGPGRRSPSPEDDALQTPQQTEVEQGTPTKSIMSNRSFETLGHYAHLTSEVEDSPTHDRQDSIPQSVSLFFLDPNCPDGTRPSSLVAPSILTAIPPSPVQQKGSLPPFESFHSSPNSVDALGTYVGLSGEPTKQVRPSEPQPVFKIHDQSRQVQSSTMYPGTRRQGLTLDLMPFVPRPQNGNRFSQYNRTSPQTPSTPCSPTTSYILTAPVKLNPFDRRKSLHPRISLYPRAGARASIRHRSWRMELAGSPSPANEVAHQANVYSPRPFGKQRRYLVRPIHQPASTRAETHSVPPHPCTDRAQDP